MLPVGNVIDKSHEMSTNDGAPHHHQQQVQQPRQQLPILQEEPIRPDMHSLLNASLKYANFGNNVQHQPQAMDENTIKWLQAAMKEHFVNPMDKINTALQLLRTSMPLITAASASWSDQDFNSWSYALEEIAFHIEIVDFACDLHRVGGLKFLIEDMLKAVLQILQNNNATANADLQVQATKLANLILEIVIVATHNNGFVQAALLNGEQYNNYINFLFEDLINNKLTNNNTSTALKRKGLSALSALMSNNAAATQYFATKPAALRSFITIIETTTDLPVKRKVLFLIYNMLNSYSGDKQSSIKQKQEHVQLLTSILEQGIVEAVLKAIKASQADLAKYEIEDVDTVENSLLLINLMLAQMKSEVDAPALLKQAKAKFSETGLQDLIVKHMAAYLKSQKRSEDEDEFFKIRAALVEFEKTTKAKN